MPTPQRISLIEAYNNRDVIAWLVRHTKEIKDLQDLVDALPASDKFVLTIGDQTINGTKSFVQKIVAAGGIEADTLVKINADLQVYGDIYQNGAAYDTHAEQLYSTKDYILMREGAVTALSPGTMSGFEIIKYDGANNLRLGVDSSGTARVGDVGDEQPLLTRDEAADLVDGAPLVWDATDNKAVSGTIDAVKKIKVEDGSLIAPDASGTLRMIVNSDGKTAPASDGLGGMEIQLPTYRINNQNFTSLTELSKNLDIVGGAGISVTASLGQVTIAATGGSGGEWTKISGNDWSSAIETVNGLVKAKKDMLIWVGFSGFMSGEVIYIPKGTIADTNFTSSLRIPIVGSKIVSGKLVILTYLNITSSDVGGSTVHVAGNEFTFAINDNAISITSGSYSVSENKAGNVVVYTRD